MHRLLAVILAATVAAPAFAQYTNVFAVNPNSTRDITVTHKAHNQANWLATISGVDLTGHEPITCGVKAAKGDNIFFALSTGTVVSATAGTVLFEFPTTSWVTNNTENVSMYGDIRLTDFDLPLPSLLVTLKPSFNWGSEVYVSPANHEYETNSISIGTKRVINFGTGFTASESGDTLNLSVSPETAVDAVARAGVASNALDIATNATNIADNTTAHNTHTNLTLALGAHGGELDPVWAAVSNLYAKLAADQTFTGTNTFTAARTIVAVLETLGGTLIGQNVAAFGDVFIGGSVQSGGSGGLRRGSGDGIVLESLVDGADIAISPTISGDSQTGHVFIANTGGWVKLGGTDDPVSLLDVEGTITTTEPISGVNAVAATDLATLGQSAWLITHEGLSGTTPEISGDASSYTITTTAATTFDLASGYTHGRDLVLTVYGTNSLTFPVEWSVLNPADLTGTNVFGTVYQGGTSYNVIQWSK